MVSITKCYCFSALINRTWFISTLVGNTFWLMALGYYVYITFLGYSGKYDVDVNHSLLRSNRTATMQAVFYFIAIL